MLAVQNVIWQNRGHLLQKINATSSSPSLSPGLYFIVDEMPFYQQYTFDKSNI